jgi:hypothetical protein
MKNSMNKSSSVSVLSGIRAIGFFIGTIGFGIYGIGQVHGYLDVFLFVIVSTLLLMLTSKFMGSRKQKKSNIVYNPNEFFMISLLFFIVLIGLYSCYSIYLKESDLGESIASYAIVLVLIIVIGVPIFLIYSYMKNINDKIIIGISSIVITDNTKSTEFNFNDIQSFRIVKTMLILEIKQKGKESIDLSELNLNSRDIKKLDFDLVTRIKKITE